MKKVILTGLLVCNLFAIGGMNSLPEDEIKVAKKIQSTLKVGKKSAYDIYINYLQSYLNKEHWQIHFQDNTDLSRSKLKDAKNRTMFISLINTGRIINISIVTFPKQSQVLIYVLETLPRKSSTVLEKFNELDSDEKFTKKRETDNFAYFSQNGYTSRVYIFVSSPVGAIQYTDFYVFDLID